MAYRLLLTVICVFILPLTAAAGDYERKDYRESYERTYERNGTESAPIHTKAPVNAPSSKSSAPYDEYSLYEWAEHNEDEEPPHNQQHRKRNSEYSSR